MIKSGPSVLVGRGRPHLNLVFRATIVEISVVFARSYIYVGSAGNWAASHPQINPVLFRCE